MGLKTTNYVSKSTGITLSTAYAVLGDLVINRKTNNARAVFLIQASRGNAENFNPIDEVEVKFVWDRKTDPAKMAYETAKTEVRAYERFNRETLKLEKGTEHGTLFGWQDDIV